MSDKLDIKEKLDDTGALIARLGGQLAAHPDDRSALLNLKSLEKRREQLEAEYEAAEASRRRTKSISSPARPANWAAMWSNNCAPPAKRCACWFGLAATSAFCGSKAPRSSRETCATPRR